MATESKTLLVFPRAVAKPVPVEPVRVLVEKVQGLTKRDKDQFKRVVASWKDDNMNHAADALSRAMERRGNILEAQEDTRPTTEIADPYLDVRQTDKYYAVASTSR